MTSTCFVLIDVFDGIDGFIKYVREEVGGECYQNLYSERQCKEGCENINLLNDSEIIVKLATKNYKGLKRKISEIKSFDGLKKVEVLLCFPGI